MSTHCRPAAPDDAEAIAGIYNHYIRNTVVTFEEEPLTPEEMHARMARASERHPWLVSGDGRGVFGYAYAAPWSVRVAYRPTVETTVYLAPDRVRQSIGDALYTGLLSRLRQQGLHSAIGVIALPNEGSVALHEKHGFRKVGEIRDAGFKHGRWVNIGYWQLML